MSQSDYPRRGDGAMHLLAGLGFLACLALAAVVWRLGPAGPAPVHMDLHGRVNGWSDSPHVAMVIAGLTAALALCYWLMGALSGQKGRNLGVARLIIVVVAVMTAVILTAATFGALTRPDQGPARLQPAVLSLLFLIVGALIGKASPNPLVGVRTYWALKSRLAWDKSNRLAGRLFFVTGLLGLIASFLAPPPMTVAAVIVAVIVSTAVAVYESWRVWRSDPERRV